MRRLMGPSADRGPLFSLAMLACCVVGSGCPGCDGEPEPEPEPQPPKAALVLGTSVEVGTFPIGADGGSVVVEGGELDGLTVTVPAEAFGAGVTVTVSYRPIEGQRVGDFFVPLSHAIALDIRDDDGAEVPDAASLVAVRIPIALADDETFAMAFAYDDAAGVLEGMAVVDFDPDAVTTAALRFSNPAPTVAQAAVGRLGFYMVAVGAGRAIFDFDIETAFEHGVDDFAMSNRRTYMAPKGQCNGQTLAALVDFSERRSQPDAEAAYTLYDNQREDPSPRFPSPNFDRDDELTFFVASSAQAEANWNDGDYNAQLVVNLNKGQQWVYEATLLAMIVTEEPQLLGVVKQDTREGHAVLAIGHVRHPSGLPGDPPEVSALVISDPNFPSTLADRGERFLLFDTNAKTFFPYVSSSAVGELDIAYDRILYLGKRSAVPWFKVVDLWAEARAGTIATRFPSWRAKATETIEDVGTKTELRGTVVVDASRLFVRLEDHLFADAVMTAYRKNGQAIGTTQAGPIALDLPPGDTVVGFLVEARPPDADVRVWAGFDWVTIRNEAPPPGAIREVGAVDLFAAAGDLAVIGDTAWVLDNEGSLVEVSAPAGAAPTLGTHQVDVAVHSSQRGIMVLNDTTLVVGGGNVVIVDLAQASGPRPTAAFNADCGRGVIVGAFAYVACGERSAAHVGLLGVVDLVDPTNLDRPRAVGELEVGAFKEARDVARISDTLIAVVDSDNDVHVVSIANPTTPTEVGFINTANGNGRALAVLDTLLLAGGDSFAVLDPASTSVPVLHESTGGTIFDLVTDGAFAYLTGEASSDRFFSILSVTDPEHPDIVQVFSPSVRGRALVVRGREALVLGNVGTGPARLVSLTW